MKYHYYYLLQKHIKLIEAIEVDVWLINYQRCNSKLLLPEQLGQDSNHLQNEKNYHILQTWIVKAALHHNNQEHQISKRQSLCYFKRNLY